MENPNSPYGAIYIQFSDCGQHIRKWSWAPFEGAGMYVHAHRVRQMVRDGVDRPKGVVPASAEDFYGTGAHP